MDNSVNFMSQGENALYLVQPCGLGDVLHELFLEPISSFHIKSVVLCQLLKGFKALFESFGVQIVRSSLDIFYSRLLDRDILVDGFESCLLDSLFRVAFNSAAKNEQVRLAHVVYRPFISLTQS